MIKAESPPESCGQEKGKRVWVLLTLTDDTQGNEDACGPGELLSGWLHD
jgi:hypothetical protein